MNTLTGSVSAQVEDRRQYTLELLRLDAATGKREILLSETCPEVWVNLHDILHTLSPQYTSAKLGTQGKDSDFHFLWGSERSGFVQIYEYHYSSSRDGNAAVCNLVGRLGPGGDWVVFRL